MRTIDITIAPDRKGRASGFLGGLTKERFVFRFDGDALPENCKLALFHADGTTLAVADCELVGNIGTAVLDTDTQQVVDALATYPVGQCAPVVLYIGSDSDIIAVVQAQLQKNWLDDSMVHPPAPLASYYTKAETQAILADYATAAALEAEAEARRCADARLCAGLANKQDKLTAGTGIHFCGNVICATGGGGGGDVCFRSCVTTGGGYDCNHSTAVVENVSDGARLTIEHDALDQASGDLIRITTEKCNCSDSFGVQGAVGVITNCLDGSGNQGISLGRTDSAPRNGSFGGSSIQFLADGNGKLKAVRAKNYYCAAQNYCLPVPESGGGGGSASSPAVEVNKCSGGSWLNLGTVARPLDADCGGKHVVFYSSSNECILDHVRVVQGCNCTLAEFALGGCGGGGGGGGSAPGTAYGSTYFQAGTQSKPFDGGNVIQFHSSDGRLLSEVSLLPPTPNGALKEFFVKSVRGDGVVCSGGVCSTINVGYNNYVVVVGNRSSIAFGKNLSANEPGMILFGGTMVGLCYGMAMAMFPKEADAGGTGYLGFYRRWTGNNLDGVRISWANWKAMLVAAGGVADDRPFFQC